MDEIVTHLEAGGTPSTSTVLSLSKGSGHSLEGAVEPLRVYLTCFQVLEAGQDDRAPTVLAAAYRQLQAQAAQIGDEELRRSFLENVAAHRELAAAVARVFPDGLPPEPEEAAAPAEPVEAITPEEPPAPAMPEPIPEAAPPAQVTVPAPAPAAPIPVVEPAPLLAEAPVVAEAPVQQPSVAPVATRPVVPSEPTVDLSGAGLAGALLIRVNLSGVQLRAVDLSQAQLRGANLSGADLWGADLVGADLRGADLTGANLCSADLQGADLRAATLAGVVYDNGTRWPEGFTPPRDAVQRE